LIKRRLFFHPVVWGRTALSGADLEVERRAQRVLRLFVGDFQPARKPLVMATTWPWFGFLHACMYLVMAERALTTTYIPLGTSYCKVVVAAWSGSPQARSQISRRVGKIIDAIRARATSF